LYWRYAFYLDGASSDVPRPEIDVSPLKVAHIPLKARTGEDGTEQQRRALLTALLEADGWRWEHIYGTAAQRSG